MRSNTSRTNRPSKWVCGPGGLNCPCCTVGSKREAKAKESRAERRRERLEVRREMLLGAD